MGAGFAALGVWQCGALRAALAFYSLGCGMEFPRDTLQSLCIPSIAPGRCCNLHAGGGPHTTLKDRVGLRAALAGGGVTVQGSQLTRAANACRGCVAFLKGVGQPVGLAGRRMFPGMCCFCTWTLLNPPPPPHTYTHTPGTWRSGGLAMAVSLGSTRAALACGVLPGPAGVLPRRGRCCLPAFWPQL